MRERDREPAFRPSSKTSSWSHHASLLHTYNFAQNFSFFFIFTTFNKSPFFNFIKKKQTKNLFQAKNIQYQVSWDILRVTTVSLCAIFFSLVQVNFSFAPWQLAANISCNNYVLTTPLAAAATNLTIFAIWHNNNYNSSLSGLHQALTKVLCCLCPSNCLCCECFCWCCCCCCCCYCCCATSSLNCRIEDSDDKTTAMENV